MMPPEGGYDHAPMPMDAVMPPPMDNIILQSDAGGLDALSDALGGPAVDPAAGDMSGGVDAAIGAAMDSAMEQGGAPAP